MCRSTAVDQIVPRTAIERDSRRQETLKEKYFKKMEEEMRSTAPQSLQHQMLHRTRSQYSYALTAYSSSIPLASGIEDMTCPAASHESEKVLHGELSKWHDELTCRAAVLGISDAVIGSCARRALYVLRLEMRDLRWRWRRYRDRN